MPKKEKNIERKSIEISDIIGGQILTKRSIISQWGFVLYLFFLVMLYISINMGVERTQIRATKNKQELTNLKADYTSKTAKLQYISKRGEITTRLETLGSNIKAPSSPAQLIKIEEKESKNKRSE